MFASAKGSARRYKSVSRSEIVTKALRDMLTRGEFPAGFHLREQPLAERMNVSRTPIRAALTALAKEGLLEPGPKRGYKVRSFSIDEIVEAFDMRATLEGAACRLLAERQLSESEIYNLREVLDSGDQVLERGCFTMSEHEPWAEMEAEFHHLIIRMTSNHLLISFLEQLNRVPLVGLQNVYWHGSESDNYLQAQLAHRDHHEIFDAIIRGQSSRAEARMRDHIERSSALVSTHHQNQTIGFDSQVRNNTNKQKLTR